MLLLNNPVTVEWFLSPIPYFLDESKGYLDLNQSSNLEICIFLVFDFYNEWKKRSFRTFDQFITIWVGAVSAYLLYSFMLAMWTILIRMCRSACITCFYNLYSSISFLDGKWTSWSPWGKCGDNCRDGVRLRSRFRECKAPTPRFGGRPCYGPNIEFEQCYNCNLNIPIGKYATAYTKPQANKIKYKGYGEDLQRIKYNWG